MDDLIAQYVEQALEARSKGLPLQLDVICAEHPELIPEVERLLRLDDAIDFEPPEDPLVGTVLADRYELVRCIGVGAMGSVYLATDKTLEREVAVKVMQNGLFASKERHERFAREARVLASLKHPNIVTVFDHGLTSQTLHFIVMECLSGVPLSHVLQRAEQANVDGIAIDSRWLSEHFGLDVPGLSYIPQVVFWCQQVAEALVDAHAAGVTHRDVKPTNIFVDESGSAILLDFGIAAKTGDGSLTADGSTIGSPWYMAPEQVGSRSAATELVDVYGLCATLYHLATLRPPYEGDYADVLTQLATRDPLPPGRVRPALSRDLCAVIERGMDRDPSRRYASMKELSADLQALYSQLPVKARPITKIGRAVRSIRRRPAPAIVALVLVLAVAGTIPIVNWYQQEAHARDESRLTEYRGVIGGLASAIAFEGSFEIRPQLDATERQGYIDQLTRALELRPGDQFVRLLRSGLLLDRGDLQPSLADIKYLAEHNESPFLRAFADRYAKVDTAKPGVLGLDLAGLPAPETDTDRVVMGFQLYRYKRYSDADDMLAACDNRHARNIRLGSLFVLGRMKWRKEDRSVLDQLLVEVSKLEEQQGCVTARTHYYRGASHHVLRDWENANAALQLSHELCPDAYGTNFNLGVVRIELDQWAAALEVLQHARKLRPANLNAAQQVSRVFAEMGDFDGAIAAIEAVPVVGLLLEPWHADFHRGYVEALRALSLFGTRDEEAAIEAEARALAYYAAALKKLAPDSRERGRINFNIQMLVLQDGDAESRCAKLLDRLRASPNSHIYLAALSVAFEQSGLMQSESLQQKVVELLSRQAAIARQRSPIKQK